MPDTPSPQGDISIDDLLVELRSTVGAQAIDLAVARLRIAQLEKQLGGPAGPSVIDSE